MKKKNNIGITTRVLGGFMSILGFSGCDALGIKDEPCMYGPPMDYEYFDYKVSGVITDSDGNPLKGIQVALYPDTVYTDEKGEFSISDRSSSLIPPIKFTDVDEEENGGEFETVENHLESYEVKQIKEGSGSYSGSYEYTVKQSLKKIEKPTDGE